MLISTFKQVRDYLSTMRVRFDLRKEDTNQQEFSPLSSYQSTSRQVLMLHGSQPEASI